MGYFSNGTEGDMYAQRYCIRCVHNQDAPGCPVWGAHSFHNYGQSDEVKDILNMFIPRSEDGMSNGQCRMFREVSIE